MSGAGLDEVLATPGAGDRAIRGGVLRVVGYGAGLLLTAAVSVLLLRYLGVVDFGRYFVVVSLIAIATALSDAGLTVVGQRGYVRADDPTGRRRFLADLLGLRLALTPVAVGASVAFALLAGYSSSQVVGTLLAGLGLVFVNAALTLTVPLSAHLRLGAVTLVEFVRQIALVLGLAALVLAGAGFVAFFTAYALSGLAMLVGALALVDRAALVRPQADRVRWSAIVRQAAPIALGLVVNVIFLRVLVLLMSLLSTPEELGLFGISYRILEVFVGLPALMAGAAFPILAHAAMSDEPRLAYVLERLAEASLLLAGAVVLGVGIAAPTIVSVVGGAEAADAAEVLTLQSAALLGAFLTQVWVLGLVAIERQGALVAVNGAGLLAVLVLGAVLIPDGGARGAAVAAIVGELVLAATALWLLVRARPALRPRAGRALRMVAAGGIGLACIALPGPDLFVATAAVAAYVGACLLFRAVPLELVRAFRPVPQSSSDEYA